MDFTNEIRYAKNLLYRNNVTTIDALDVVSEGYSENGFCKKKMQSFVLNEKRRNKTYLIDEKICTQCKELRNKQEYYFRVDYRFNCRYYMQPCKHCFKLNYKHKKTNHDN